MVKNMEVGEQITCQCEKMVEKAWAMKERLVSSEFSAVQELEQILQASLEKMEDLLTELLQEEELFSYIKEKTFVNAKDSFERLCSYHDSHSAQKLAKLEFEFIPFLRVLHLTLHYCCFVKGDEKKEAQFELEDYKTFLTNHYIAESEEKKQYKYDITILVLAYNQLEYTKKCVQSILDTVDPNLNYELILMNHGSSDGTKEYFQSIGCTKQLDFKENDLKFSFLMHHLVVEGRFYCGVTNDVILGENAVENMRICISSQESFKYIVPTTTSMPNHQEPLLPEDCTECSDILAWGAKNNQSDPYRWEQRAMLYNPVSFCRSADLFGADPLFLPPFRLRFTGFEGGDVTISALIRRSGNKCILAKDAFCYHEGHITRKHEAYANDESVRQKKVDAFEKAIALKYQVTGRCYSNTLMKEIDVTGSGHKEVLGINCGLGSNPLKVKERYKEHGHNLDCFVTNLQDSEEFLLDLPSLSDRVVIATQWQDLKEVLSEKKYHCILWEDPLNLPYEEGELYQALREALEPEGVLLLAQPSDQAKAYFSPHHTVEYINYSRGVECLVYQKQ